MGCITLCPPLGVEDISEEGALASDDDAKSWLVVDVASGAGETAEVSDAGTSVETGLTGATGSAGTGAGATTGSGAGCIGIAVGSGVVAATRSEEHTSELQSQR